MASQIRASLNILLLVGLWARPEAADQRFLDVRNVARQHDYFDTSNIDDPQDDEDTTTLGDIDDVDDDRRASDVDDVQDEDDEEDSGADIMRTLGHVHNVISSEDSGDADPRDEQHALDDMEDADTAILKKLGNLHDTLSDTSEAMIETSSQDVDDDGDDFRASDGDDDVQDEPGMKHVDADVIRKEVDDAEDNQDDQADGAEDENIFGNLASVGKMIAVGAGAKHPWGMAVGQQEQNEIEEDAGAAILRNLHHVHEQISGKSEGTVSAGSVGVGSDEENESDDATSTAGDDAVDVIAHDSESQAVPDTAREDAEDDGSDEDAEYKYEPE